MATRTRQDRTRASDAYDDSMSAGATLETGSTTLADDLNALRSQIRRIVTAFLGGTPKWYDAPGGIPGATPPVVVSFLSTDLDGSGVLYVNHGLGTTTPTVIVRRDDGAREPLAIDVVDDGDNLHVDLSGFGVGAVNPWTIKVSV